MIKKIIALVHLINCKLLINMKWSLETPYSKCSEGIRKGLREANRKCNLLISENLQHLYEYAAVRTSAPRKSTQENNLETSRQIQLWLETQYFLYGGEYLCSETVSNIQFRMRAKSTHIVTKSCDLLSLSISRRSVNKLSILHNEYYSHRIYTLL